MRVDVPKPSLLKRILPRSLLWRSLLMILVPLIAVQAVALQIFYGNHLDIISRRFALAIAGEIAMTVDLLNRLPDEADRLWVLENAGRQWEMAMRVEPDARLPAGRRTSLIGPVDGELAAAGSTP